MVSTIMYTFDYVLQFVYMPISLQIAEKRREAKAKENGKDLLI